jgi:hypothetical protein
MAGSGAHGGPTMTGMFALLLAGATFFFSLKMSRLVTTSYILVAFPDMRPTDAGSMRYGCSFPVLA